MEQYEKVERLSQRTGATFEEAKHALEACNWDMLDAAILLEKQNKNGAKQKVFSTDYEAQPGYKNVAASQEPRTNSKREMRYETSFGDKVKDLFRKSHVNHLVIKHNDKVIVSLPIWAAILITAGLFKLVVILLVVSLICGCKLSFEGPDNKKMDSVKKAVNTAGDAMSGAAAAFKTSFQENYRKDNKPVAPEQPAASAQPEKKASEEPEQPEAPVQTAEEFEKEDFRAIAEGLDANTVTTDDGKITLEL